MFNRDTFQKCLKTSWLGSEFIYVKETGSTNSLLKEIPDDRLIHGTVLLAENQYEGRGQYLKRWESAPGENLTFTIAFRPARSDRLTLLTLFTAWAINQALLARYPGNYAIKWPNDLILNGKKLGGILTECLFNGQKLNRVLVGVGLNIGQTLFSEEIATSATSLAIHTGRKPEREKVLAGILLMIEEAYRGWHTCDARQLAELNRNVIGYGKWVEISINGDTLEDRVKFLGVNEKGELVILSKDLEIKTFSYEQVRIIADHPSG